MSRRVDTLPCLLTIAAFAAIAPAAAVADVAAPTVTSVGTAQVKPTPVDRTSDVSIRKAVERAESKALPAAVAEAREYAAKLAAAGGVRLGSLLSISNAPPTTYPFGYSAQNGTFGNGRFCGRVRSFKTVIAPNGTRRRVPTGTRRTCRVPGTVSVSVSVVFAIAG